MNDCVFCKIANEKISIEKIYENDNFFSISDKNQKVEGHSLVIPKKHFVTTLDIPSSMGADLIDCIKNTFLKISKNTGAEGFNLVNNNFEVAGQFVMHAHFHILPRKEGGKIPYCY